MFRTPKQDKETLFVLLTFHQPNRCFCFCLISSERVYKKGQYFEIRIATFCVKCIKILKCKVFDSKQDKEIFFILRLHKRLLFSEKYTFQRIKTFVSEI